MPTDKVPYSYSENAEFVKEMYIQSELLAEEIDEAYEGKLQEVKVIDDTEEETVTDEPIIRGGEGEQINEPLAELEELFSEEEEKVKDPELIPIDDEPTPFEDEEEEQTDEEEDDGFENEEDFEEESEQEETEKKPKPTPKKDEKGIKDRPRKQKPQLSLFDLMEPQEKSEQELLIERSLKYGSGFQHGKYRIFDKYNENPTAKAFADFLKREYGIGGRGGWGGDNEQHDGNLYLNGYSIKQIKEYLEENKIPTKKGNPVWGYAVVSNILTNERYCGDMLLQKTFTENCITKKVKKNRGEKAKYFIANNHAPIVSQEMFKRVQQEMARRRGKRQTSDKATTALGKYSGKFALSELLVCGECGSPYKRVTWVKNGVSRKVWRCLSRVEHGNKFCPESPALDESKLHAAICRGLTKIAC